MVDKAEIKQIERELKKEKEQEVEIAKRLREKEFADTLQDIRKATFKKNCEKERRGQ